MTFKSIAIAAAAVIVFAVAVVITVAVVIAAVIAIAIVRMLAETMMSRGGYGSVACAVMVLR